MKTVVSVLSILFMGLMVACAGDRVTYKKPASYPQPTASDLVTQSRLFSDKSKNSVTPKEKVHFASEGMKTAEKCVKTFPKEVGCYFFRAVNTGLYYQASPTGYQKGLKRMIADAEKVIALQPAYEEGGGYQILGNIYLQSPSFSLAKNAVTKDVDRALEYAEKAIKMGPHDVGNRYLLAEVYLEADKVREAVPLLKSVVRDLPKKKPFTWYDKTALNDAKRLLNRAEKRLPK